MNIRRFALVGLIALWVIPHVTGLAASGYADEAAIRALIAQRDAGQPVPSLPDRVFWTAAFQKPIVGDEKPTPRTHERGLENRVPNSEKYETHVRRIVIAKSGDLAYEYSDGLLTFDLATGEHISSPNSTLRVWQKVDGQWKQAAVFSMTHYRD